MGRIEKSVEAHKGAVLAGRTTTGPLSSQVRDTQGNKHTTHTTRTLKCNTLFSNKFVIIAVGCNLDC